MTTLDELKRTLGEQAGLAPDATGLVERARSGAVRLRRRNRIRTVIAVVVGVALAAAIPSVVRLSTTDPAPEPAEPIPHYREPHQLGLELAPGSAYFTMVHGTRGSTQYLIARPAGAVKGVSGGTVAAHDPGTFDAARLRRGEPVTVQGRPAFYVDRLEAPAPASSGPGPEMSPYRIGAAVGWQDPSGAWVIVFEGADRAELLRLAESVRLTPPVTARGPVRFGWVPADLPVTYTETRDVAANGLSATIGFGEPADQQPGAFLMMPHGTPLSVTALPMNGIMTAWGEDYTDRPAQVIAGHRTRYVEGDGGNLTTGPAGSHLMIEAGSCGVTVVVQDRTRIPYGDLVRMVENMTFGGCEETTDWMPIVGP